MGQRGGCQVQGDVGWWHGSEVIWGGGDMWSGVTCGRGKGWQGGDMSHAAGLTWVSGDMGQWWHGSVVTWVSGDMGQGWHGSGVTCDGVDRLALISKNNLKLSHFNYLFLISLEQVGFEILHVVERYLWGSSLKITLLFICGSFPLYCIRRDRKDDL